MKRTVACTAAALALMPMILTEYSRAQAVNKGPTAATRAGFTLTVLNPQGPVKKVRDLAPRLKTLEGKKLAMWLSSTPDQLFAGKGAELYDLLAKMLKEKIPSISIVSYRDLPMKFAPVPEVAAAIEATRPDAVIAGFGG
jgi:hypothetical protein